MLKIDLIAHRLLFKDYERHYSSYIRHLLAFCFVLRFFINEMAKEIINDKGSSAELVLKSLLVDGPKQRRLDISKAIKTLN